MFGCFCQTGKKSNTKSIDNVLILYVQKALLLWGQSGIWKSKFNQEHVLQTDLFPSPVRTSLPTNITQDQNFLHLSQTAKKWLLRHYTKWIACLWFSACITVMVFVLRKTCIVMWCFYSCFGKLWLLWQRYGHCIKVVTTMRNV